LFEKLVDANIAPNIDNSKLQVIINEYKPVQGIGEHIDDPKKFGNWIISLNSGCEIVFANKKTNEILGVYVNRCSRRRKCMKLSPNPARGYYLAGTMLRQVLRNLTNKIGKK
jgi:hypothetical protein